MSRAFVLGLTGPTGSGKSIVADIFCQNGYVRIDADKIARRVVEKGSPALLELQQHFGDSIINADGTLNRKALAQIAFCDKENTLKLNEITHPFIIESVKAQISDYESAGHSKIVYDAPLLFESGTDSLCDKIVTVIADKAVRIERIKRRDNLTDEQARDRLKAQHDDEFYTLKSDFVIVNNDDTVDLSDYVHDVIDKLEVIYGALRKDK